MTSSGSPVCKAILLTGGTGTLGSLAATALLRHGNVDIVAPVRAHHPANAVQQLVASEFAIAGQPDDANWPSRLHQIPLPEGIDDPTMRNPTSQLDVAVAEFGVTEIIHTAGCLNYFDEAALLAVNVELTRRLVEAAKRWKVQRFIHISTAFASGFVDGLIAEQLHDDPTGDPTFYTESKRRGERIVAESGLPYLILRPSIVIGDSRDGHYAGPRYGLYQLWSGVERFLLDRWHEELHYVAPQEVIPLLHQDAFQVGLLAAMNGLPDNSICHLTSRGGPTVRELSDELVNRYIRPKSIRYYDTLADVPRTEVPPRQRAFLNLAAVNIEISSRCWDFDTSSINSLVAAGAEFADATLETVRRCQEAYFDGSDRLTRYEETYGDCFPAKVCFEHTRT